MREQTSELQYPDTYFDVSCCQVIERDLVRTVTTLTPAHDQLSCHTCTLPLGYVHGTAEEYAAATRAATRTKNLNMIKLRRVSMNMVGNELRIYFEFLIELGRHQCTPLL